LDRQTMNATAHDIYEPKQVSLFVTLPTFETTAMFTTFDIDRLLGRQVMHDFTWILRLEMYGVACWILRPEIYGGTWVKIKWARNAPPGFVSAAQLLVVPALQWNTHFESPLATLLEIQRTTRI
jgi:hypothetical protein